MISTKRIFNLGLFKQIQCRCFCVEGYYSGLAVDPKFNQEDQNKILNTLNSCNNDQLSSFKVSKMGIRNLEIWKSQKGPFRTLNEVLEVDGLSMTVLKRICKNITVGNDNKIIQTVKSRRQFVTPTFNNEKNLSSAIGINLTPTGISWAKLIRSNNELECWGFRDFSSLPKKMTTPETFRLASSILKDIPVGEVYIFEGYSSMGTRMTIMSSYIQHVELTSMLYALLTVSSKHNLTLEEDSNRDVVYYLKANLFPRLFCIFMGTERVSTTDTVSELLGARINSDCKLPCTSINVSQKLKDYYYHSSKHSNCQELLGQALLLTITFMDLCVYKNPISLATLKHNKKK